MRPPAATMQLAIAFQDGFENDTVVVRVDGTEAYRADGLTTRTQISHADDTTLDAPEGAQVEVEVPTRGISETIPVDPARPNVAISLFDGTLIVAYPERLGFA